MDQVVKAASPEDIARVEARNKFQQDMAAFSDKGAPTFVNKDDGSRVLVVPLDNPVEWDGKVISEVTIRRPVMREWRAYLRACQDAVKVNGPGADDFVDQPWLSVPAIVFENLDFVDASRVEAAQEGFFEKSPQADGKETEASPSTSTSGDQ